MAIGDTPNQNLFGTNYNAEEEERKKAELAAQGAMMGAGNVPASAFGQAPAVAPFSMEAAGQVNPMMQAQSLEAPASAPNPVTFLPYADDVSTPRASALSVFTPGGEVKPNVDVNAITPSPEMTSTSAVNTALNQEVPVDTVNNEPGFLYNTFVNAPVQADQKATEFMRNLGEKISTGYDNLLGSAMRNLTPVEDSRFTNNESFGKTFTDTFAITRPDGTKFYPDEVTSQTATQPPVATETQFPSPESLALPSETVGQIPSVNAFSAENAGQVNPMMEAQSLEATQGEATVTPPTQTLSQFMRYEDAPEQRTEQFVDAQGRLRFRPTQEALRLQAQGEVAQPPVDSAVPAATTQPPVDALSSFEQDSLARQQRIGGTGSFEGDSEAREARLRENERRPGESQADRDTRVAQSKTTSGQTAGLSFDDARRRAEGELAARGVERPRPSQVNALARALQAGEPERLAELETKRALDAAKLRDAEAKKDFKPQIVEIGDQRLIQLAPEYYQPIRPEPKEDEPFEPRILEHNGFVYYEVKPNSFERQPSTGQTREDILAEIKRRNEVMGATPAEGADASDIESFATEAEAKASGAKGEVIIGGRRAVIE